jgi:hypothetical protein
VPKQARAFGSQCDGRIDANDGEGKVGSLEKGQDDGVRAISILRYFFPKP